jgi:hypothetical protein
MEKVDFEQGERRVEVPCKNCGTSGNINRHTKCSVCGKEVCFHCLYPIQGYNFCGDCYRGLLAEIAQLIDSRAKQK